jgi:hypothetical protein
MRTDIKQGIVTAQQSPDFIFPSGNSFGFNATVQPIVISFSNGGSETLYVENERITKAWVGPFPRDIDHWLYWDLNTDGIRTFGNTTVEPYKFNPKLNNPKLDQHWYDHKTNQMKVWDGKKWVIKLRVFAAKVVSGRSVIPYKIGSQINNTLTKKSGVSIFSDNKIIKNNEQFKPLTPITSETKIITDDYISKIEKEQIVLKTQKVYPKYTAISLNNQDSFIQIASVEAEPCFALLTESTTRNGKVFYIRRGMIKDHYFERFKASEGDVLWLDVNGGLTTSINYKHKFIQKIGKFVTSDTVIINIEHPLYS